MNEDKVEQIANSMGLREVIPGIIRFTIKANDTEENLKVHTAFKEFCKAETDNSYTMGLRKLLESYQGDYKYDSLYQHILQLKMELDQLKEELKDKKEDKGKERF